jgi:DNA-binding NarL/FixJ family response regulator
VSTNPAPLSNERLRVFLVDDHEIFRRGLAKLLTEKDVEVVGEAGDGEAAISLIRCLEPDVAVVDLNLPGMSGIELVSRLSQEAPPSQVLVLTISGDDAHVTQALLAGACGYLLKDTSIDEIVAGVRAAAEGDSMISPKVATKLVEQIRGVAPSAERGSPLSGRELDVLRLVAEGKDNREIGELLRISAETVKKHISSILMKSHTDNRTQAAVYAVRRGLV